MSEPELTSPPRPPPPLHLAPEVAGVAAKPEAWVLTPGERIYPVQPAETGSTGLLLGGAALALAALAVGGYLAHHDQSITLPAATVAARPPIAAVVDAPQPPAAETAQLDRDLPPKRGGAVAAAASPPTAPVAAAASPPAQSAPVIAAEPAETRVAEPPHETGSLAVPAATPIAAPHTAVERTPPVTAEPPPAPTQPTIMNAPPKLAPATAPARKEAAAAPEAARPVAAAAGPRVMSSGPRPPPPSSDTRTRPAKAATATEPLPSPGRLRPPQVDSSDPVQVRAASVGLHPRLPRELLAKLSPTDLHNADVAIRTAVAEAPDGVPYRHPAKPWDDDATFVVRIVPGGTRDCRRYVVTVVKDGWSTTAPPMETCELPPQPRRF